jgi:hypothetical protein
MASLGMDAIREFSEREGLQAILEVDAERYRQAVHDAAEALYSELQFYERPSFSPEPYRAAIRSAVRLNDEIRRREAGWAFSHANIGREQAEQFLDILERLAGLSKLPEQAFIDHLRKGRSPKPIAKRGAPSGRNLKTPVAILARIWTELTGKPFTQYLAMRPSGNSATEFEAQHARFVQEVLRAMEPSIIHSEITRSIKSLAARREKK